MRSLLALIVTMLSVCTSLADERPQFWTDGFNAVNAQADKYLKAPNKKNPHWHVHPSSMYKGVYLWDSAFISLIWKHKNAFVAEEIIRSVLHNQQPDGRVPHVKSILGGVSKWTQPPLLSWAAADILTKTQNPKFAADIYGKLRKYHQWLWKSRRASNGLFFWAHAYESGIDNSPRFGNRDESHYNDTTKIGAVDFSSYLVIDSESLIQIARFMLDHNIGDKALLEDDIRALKIHADQTSQAINNLLWNEQDGIYYDLDLPTGKQIKISTVASFFPLTAGVASKEQYLRLRTLAVDPKKYNTRFPFPTVAHDDPTFEKDMWRGAVWINTSFLAIRGFKRYGDIALVKHFSQNLIDSVYRTWVNKGTFFEFYDPDRYDFKEVTRKEGLGLNLGFVHLSGSKKPGEILKHLFLKQLLLGQKPVGKFVGWTGLVNTLAIEELGFKAD